MRHFDFLDSTTRARLFHLEPGPIDRDGPLDEIAHALGATLYLPAVRPDLAREIATLRTRGATSVVVCLEDAIADDAVEDAVRHVGVELALLAEVPDRPLVFVRVRNARQPAQLVALLGPAAHVLDGFVLPKFSAARGEDDVAAVRACEGDVGHRLLVMPVVETPAVIHLESRRDELLGIREVLVQHTDRVPAVRVGATDLASTYALRRTRDVTIHDVRVVADAIADVVNVLGRPEDGFLVSGPVWEYFAAPDRIFKPQLRATPFVARDDPELRARLLAHDLDGLIREVVLDRANGLSGKTVIHPSHVGVVHALSVVSHEEHSDASEILDRAGTGGGVIRSAYRNKMNEVSPHQAWARRVLKRAGAFGVAAPDVTFVDLIGAAAERVGL